MTRCTITGSVSGKLFNIDIPVWNFKIKVWLWNVRINLKLYWNCFKRAFFEHTNGERSIYYITELGRWFIGENTGDFSRYVEAHSIALCLEETTDADWFEYDSSSGEFIKSESLQIRCIDDIECSCQKLDISGFEYQATRNGLYAGDGVTLNGRKCFWILMNYEIALTPSPI